MFTCAEYPRIFANISRVSKKYVMDCDRWSYFSTNTNNLNFAIIGHFTISKVTLKYICGENLWYS